MKNITVSLPDEVYRRVRIRAAELDKSVSGLVRELLLQVGEEESDFEHRARLQDEILATIKKFRAGDRLPRDAAHKRHGIR